MPGQNTVQNTAATDLSLTRQIVLLMCGIPATLIFTSLAPVLPKMEAALAHDATDQMLVRMVIGINGIAMVVGAPLAGFLADRYGRIPLIVGAMTLWAVFGCSGYFISDLYLMVATRFLTAMMGATSLTKLTPCAQEGTPMQNRNEIEARISG